MCDKLMYTVKAPLNDHLRDRTKWQLEKGGGMGVILHLFVWGEGSAPLLLLIVLFCGI